MVNKQQQMKCLPVDII